MPGDRPTVADHMEAHRELSIGKHRIIPVLHPRQGHGIAHDALSRRHDNLRLAVEGDRPAGMRHEHAAARLQGKLDIIEGDGIVAEGVGKTDARLATPDVGAQDQAEGLLRRAALGRRQGEF